jgi:hypothetical protein
LSRIASELADASEAGSASAAPRQHGATALRCTEGTQARAGQVLALSQQALAAGAGTASTPTLEQIKEQAESLNRGVAAAGESGCGLEEVKRQLDQVAPAARTG